METAYDGIVLWYNDKIGYGLINGADGETYFIHHKDIISSSMDEVRHRNHLLKGDKVKFDWCWKPNTNNTKRQAVNLSVVNEEADNQSLLDKLKAERGVE